MKEITLTLHIEDRRQERRDRQKERHICTSQGTAGRRGCNGGEGCRAVQYRTLLVQSSLAAEERRGEVGVVKSGKF